MGRVKMREILDKEISLLLKEAEMAKKCLGDGLTQVRKCNTDEPGKIYMASLLVSNGLERMMKIILVQNYRLNNNGEFPNNNYLKNKGHKLFDLYRNIIQLKDELNLLEIGDVLKENEISEIIFQYFNDFANGTRYYNLDELTNSNKKSKNPLIEWEYIGTEILKKHKKIRKGTFEKMLDDEELMKFINNSIVTFKFNSNNEIYSSTEIYLNKYKNYDYIQGYFTYYILKIIKYLNVVLEGIESKIANIPFTNEFFEYFTIVDSDIYKNYQVRKIKNWSRY
jgi:hypothetical protein